MKRNLGGKVKRAVGWLTAGRLEEKWKSFQERRKTELSAEESEFLPAVLEITEKPVSPTWHYAVWTIAGFMLIGLLWAIFGHVDEVAVAPGKLIPSGYVKTLQAEGRLLTAGGFPAIDAVDPGPAVPAWAVSRAEPELPLRARHQLAVGDLVAVAAVPAGRRTAAQ